MGKGGLIAEPSLAPVRHAGPDIVRDRPEKDGTAADL
jgi:hypothetical protein